MTRLTLLLSRRLDVFALLANHGWIDGRQLWYLLRASSLEKRGMLMRFASLPFANLEEYNLSVLSL